MIEVRTKLTRRISNPRRKHIHFKTQRSQQHGKDTVKLVTKSSTAPRDDFVE
jgi:hypothetical protein